MKSVQAGYEILDFPNEGDFKRLERIGRICYKSEDRITGESYIPFIESIVKRGHEAVIEHLTATVLFVVDRGVSHELVRHRLASYCQVSTRYVNYAKHDELEFVEPCFLTGNYLADPGRQLALEDWKQAMQHAEATYLHMVRAAGAKPQEARSVLPNSLKTEIVVTANLREWRHIFWLRTAAAAHPQMREVMVPLSKDFAQRAPFLFSVAG